MDEVDGMTREFLVAAGHDAVGALGKPFADGTRLKVFVALLTEADAHHDGDAETQPDVFLDHRPPPHFQAHIIG